MSTLTAHVRRRIDLAFLALLAYLPALLSSPGRMPADTKLYLYTDPGGLLGRAASTFEPDQFAGWVPHQQITYLWPSGPWFWSFDLLSVPDWIAHRLWIGTVVFTAGAGALHCVRLLGHRGAAALAAAAIYQLSPYLLPYVSRTSLLLLPWAGLGWIVAATIRSTRPDSSTERTASSIVRRWREPAVIALIVATVGSTNATALAMVVPAPLLWLVLVAAQRVTPIRQVVQVAARVTVACVAVSLWWIAMLVVQSRAGAPVLLYSETLEDVSRNSSGPEILRGMGYWLFYGRDAFAATTTSAIDYLTRSSGIAISYLLALVGLVGIAFGRSPHRRFAALLTVTGMVLAVGVHPVDSPSPLMRFLTGDDETGLALALRSSTRAMPVAMLGLALGVAALVERFPPRPIRPSASAILSTRRLAAGAVVLLAIVNMPSLWRAQLVDPAIDRDADVPAAWVDAAAALDAGPSDTRVLQLPGAEFGAFDWGYTVDQPLVSASNRDLITRDLLPLGSAAAMDLLYALDDRVQSGTLEPDAVVPVSRLLGVGTIWVANDVDALRFRTPAPGSVAAALSGAPGLSPPKAFGVPTAPVTTLDPFGRPLVDADAVGIVTSAIAPVALLDVDDADEITRVKTTDVIVSGSGDGLVDAAAAGLLDGGELIRYGSNVELIEPDTRVIVTDSNRDRARHWRSSQDVTGHTEPGGSDPDVLVPTAADQRLDPLGTADDADAQTIAIQRGPVSAIASSYGEPFAYRPEDRAAMAIDGVGSTAWSVGDHDDPVGATLRLGLAEPVDRFLLHQIPPPVGGRQIATVAVVADGTSQVVDLTASSVDGSGQPVVLAAPATTIDVVITAITAGDPMRTASRAGVGFVEIDTGLGPTLEFVRPPVDTLDRLATDHRALDVVFTRDRVAATSFWRNDPEPTLRRLLPLSSPDTFELTTTLRLDQRASDADIAALIGGGAIANRRLPGIAHRGAAAVDGDDTTAWLTPIDEAVGSQLTVATITDSIDELDLLQPAGDWSAISEITASTSNGEARLAVPVPDDAGRSRVDLPAGLVTAGQPLTITISGVEPLEMIERRYGDTITMPAGIAELTSTVGIEAAPPRPDQRVAAACGRSPITPLTVDGAPLPMQFDTDVGALLAGDAVTASPCDGPVGLDVGDHRIVEQTTDPALTVDRVVLSSTDRPTATDDPAAVRTIDQGARNRRVEVDCPRGCWLVYGMGHNPAWEATGPSGSLGDQEVVDGGFNGWWITPTSNPVRIDLTWTAQRPVTLGLALSLAAVLACGAVLLVAARTRRHADDPLDVPVPRPVRARPPSSRPIVVLVVASATVALAIAPVWGLVVLVVGGLDVAAGRRARAIPLLAVSGLIAAVFVAVSVVVIERRDAPFPNAGWTTAFDHLNGLALTAVALVALSVFIDGERTPQ